MSMRKARLEDLKYRRQEVIATNIEKVYTEGTGDVMVKLNCEYSNAAKTIMDVL
jgi:hypothetical protein